MTDGRRLLSHSARHRCPRGSSSGAKRSVSERSVLTESPGTPLTSQALTDQPAFEIFGRRFGMKLKCDHVTAVCERLIPADRRGSQQLGTCRQIERITVPVQHGHALEMAHDALFSWLGEDERCPPDSFARPG